MATNPRKPGISLVGDLPWGTHFCHFYETKEDLVHTLVPYFKAGLESNECCVWVVSEPVSEEEARGALRTAVFDLDRYEANGSMEILAGREWYFNGGVFDRQRVSSAWIEKLDRALARGYDGMRVSENVFWFRSAYWKDLCEYEKSLNDFVNNKRMTVLCTYSLPASSAGELLDVSPMHHFAIATRNGNSAVIEPPGATPERKRVEEEVAFHARLLENLHDAVVATDDRLVVTAWNRAAEGIYGWTADEVIGRDVREVVRSELDPARRDEVLRVAAETGYYRVETIHHRKDGTPINVEGSVMALRDATGRVTGYVTAHRDITERKRAEEALQRDHEELEQRVIERTRQLTAVNEELKEERLRRSEAFLAEGQRISHTGSWSVKLPSEDVFWSQEAFRVYGLDPGTTKLSQQLAFQLIHPEDRPFVQEAFERALRDKSDYSVEHRAILADGSIKHFHALGHPVLNEFGDLVEYIGTVMDITERKRSEQRLAVQYAVTRILAESNTLAAATPDLLRAIGENMQLDWGALWIVDRQAAMIGCQNIWHAPNLEAAEFNAISRKTRFTFGQGFPGQVWQRSESIWSESIWTDDAMKNPNYVRAPIAASMGLRTAIGFPLVVAGEPFGVIEFFGRAVARPDKEQVATLSAIRSQISQFVERRGAEEGLHAARAELARISRVMTMGQLTASIAHEVSQPLAAIAINANAGLGWLAGTTPNLDNARGALHRIIRDGNRAGDVITRIRMLLRENDAAKERLDINEVIQEVVALVQDEIQRHGAAFRMELADNLPSVLGDRVQLQQVLLNLITNGIETMSEITDRPRELILKTQQDEVDKVCVTVQDSGIGIDPQSLARIFEAFYTTKPQGMGIGLSISRSIIESHGGRLWAAPNDGPGATFQFTLPISKPGAS